VSSLNARSIGHSDKWSVELFFQRSVAAILLVQAACLTPDFGALFDSTGVYRQELMNAMHDGLPRAAIVQSWLNERGLSNWRAAEIFFLIYLGSLGLLFANRAVRWAALAAVIAKLSWGENSPGALYGVDRFSSIALFMCFVFPAKRPRVESLPGRNEQSAWHLKLSLRSCLQFLLCLCYFASGVEKAMGFDWWNGNAIWRAAHFDPAGEWMVNGLERFPGLAVIAGLATLLLEAGYVFGVQHPRTRGLFVSGIVLMHLGIIASMQLYFFGALMILLNVAAWWPLGHTPVTYVQSIAQGTKCLIEGATNKFRRGERPAAELA
jgi:hypothetical protein